MLKFIFDNFKGMLIGGITTVFVAIFWFVVRSEKTYADVEQIKPEIKLLRDIVIKSDTRWEFVEKELKESRQERLQRLNQK
jgi:hypothetical protein